MLAEKVLESIKESRESESDRKQFFIFIINKVRANVKYTDIKINQELCNSIFDEEKYIAGLKTLDISLIPCLSNEGEFILWLAVFIEYIIIDESKKRICSFTRYYEEKWDIKNFKGLNRAMLGFGTRN